jgi:hypothetical protein
MAGCGNKTKQTCNSSMYAVCVKSELAPPPYSSLVDCFSTEEVDIDQYAILTKIKSEIDMSGITATCGTLPTIKETNDFIQYLVNRDCIKDAQITTLTARVITLETKVTAIQANPCP